VCVDSDTELRYFTLVGNVVDGSVIVIESTRPLVNFFMEKYLNPELSSDWEPLFDGETDYDDYFDR